jgi:hypothetical protein
MGFEHVIPTDDRLVGLTVPGWKQESPTFFNGILYRHNVNSQIIEPEARSMLISKFAIWHDQNYFGQLKF